MSVFFEQNIIKATQTLYRMSSLFRSYECLNIARVNIGVLTGWKKIKQPRISFVLGYLRMIKLETKIMNFMSVFFEQNIIKATQVLSIICNTICSQLSLYACKFGRINII
jgi:hypothetical protein